MSTVIALYLIGTLLAALCAVVASFLFPSTLALAQEAASSAPGGNSKRISAHPLFFSFYYIIRINRNANANLRLH